MCNRHFHILIAWCLLVLAPVVATAQEAVDTVSSIPGITIETSVDKTEIYVGDRITYTVSITHDSTIELIPPPLGANLGAFEVKDYRPDQQTRLEDGRIRNESEFIISTFTTGDYVIPPLPVLFRLPDSTSKLMLAEGLSITVSSLLGDNADTLDIRPLKAPYEFPRELNLYLMLGALVAFLAILIVIWWLLLRRKKLREAVVDTRTAWEIAFEDLAVLQQKQLVEEDTFEPYYVALTEIARAFLGRMYTVDVLEMTTDEFGQVFAGVEMPGGVYDSTMEFLHHADLVKFARYTPESERAESDLSLVHELISTVRDDYLRRQETEVNIKNGDNDTPQPEKETAV